MKLNLIRFKPYFRLVSCIVFLALIFITLELSGLRSEFTIPRLQKLFENNLFNGALFFIGAFTLGNLAGIPGWIFLVSSVYALGKVNGYLLTTTAALVSTAVSFYLVRLIGQDGLRKITHPLAVKLLKKLHSDPLKINILLRVFFQTLPPLNYSLALSGISFRDYFLGALIGLPVPLLIITLLFNEVIKFLN